MQYEYEYLRICCAVQKCVFPQLTELNLSTNALHGFPFAALACEKLRALDLSNNCIGERGAVRMPAERDAPSLTALHSRVHFHLMHLDLSSNSLADFPLEFVNAYLQVLETLNLEKCAHYSSHSSTATAHTTLYSVYSICVR